jgi:hypothetical protein
MLHNTTVASLQTRTMKMFESLDASPFAFYLTGSRFFGGTHSNSDYDFFAEDSLELREILRGLGFYQEDSSYKDDQLIETVYRLMPVRNVPWDNRYDHDEDVEKYPVVPGQEGFDIQLVKPGRLALKLQVQNILKESFPYGLTGSKFERAKTWNLVVTTVRCLEQKAA